MMLHFQDLPMSFTSGYISFQQQNLYDLTLHRLLLNDNTVKRQNGSRSHKEKDLPLETELGLKDLNALMLPCI